MGKMLDNVRALWNSLADGLTDPGKLAQLSVADLEKAIRQAKEAAAPIIGRPTVLESQLRETQSTDKELTNKIMALLKSGEQGQEAAKKYIERQVVIRKEMEELKEDYEDSHEAAEEWQNKIRFLESELYSRRNAANKLQAEYETSKAEQVLGKQMQNVDSLMGSDTFSSAKARVEKEKAKAAGYSAMSGLSGKIADDKLIRDAEANSLMNEYLAKLGE